MKPFAQPRPPRARRRQPARPGFTLVEILTATAIMALVVSLVMTILSQVMTAWDESSDKLTMSGDAREVLGIMSQDLQAAVFRRDNTNSQWLALNPNDTTGPNSVGASKLANDTQFSRLIFYSAAPLHQSKDNSGSGGSPSNPIYGDLCLIEYRVQYQDPFGNSALGPSTFTFILHRVVVDPATTFMGINGFPLMGLSTHNTSNNYDLMSAFDKFIDVPGQTTYSTPPAGTGGVPIKVKINGAGTTDSAILSNVGQFTVVLYYYSNNFGVTVPAVQSYPMSVPGTAQDYYFGGWPVNSPNQGGYLDSYTANAEVGTFVSMAYADITLTILNDEGIAIMQQNAGDMPEGMTWPQFIQNYGTTFTQRVYFQNKPE